MTFHEILERERKKAKQAIKGKMKKKLKSRGDNVEVSQISKDTSPDISSAKYWLKLLQFFKIYI